MCIPPFIQPCALSLVFFPVSDGALADPWALPLQSVVFSPHISHVLTTSRWCRGEGCGRAINLAPVPCQTKLPLLFLQQSLSNYGFHTCREAKPNHLTLLCHCHMPLGSNADRQGSEETGEVPWLEESLLVDNMQKWCMNEWRPFMGIQPCRNFLSTQL